MKATRLVSILLVLTLLISSITALAEEDPNEYEYDDGIPIHVFVREPAYNSVFAELDQVIDNFREALGYQPNFEIYYSDQIVEIYLFNTTLEVECLIDKNTRRVLIPDVVIPYEIIEANNLSEKFLAEEYNIHALTNENYTVITYEDNDKRLLVTAESSVEGEESKTIDCFAWDYFYSSEDETYYVSREDFIQMWYDIHSR